MVSKMSDDFKARDVQFFTNFKKVKFKSYNVKNCRLSQDEMIKIIEHIDIDHLTIELHI